MDGGGTVDRAEGPPGALGRRLEYADNPRTTAVDRHSTPSARAGRQEPLSMFRFHGLPSFPDRKGIGKAEHFPRQPTANDATSPPLAKQPQPL